MAVPRGQFGNRLDTAAGQAKEAAMQAAAQAAASGNAAATQMAAAASTSQAFRDAVASTLAQNTPAAPPSPSPTNDPGWSPSDPNSPANVQAAADKAAADRDAAARASEQAIIAAQEALRQKNAIATMEAALQSFGLTSLYNTVVDFIKNGYDAEAVTVLIRTTPEYKQRFPAMEALAQKGRAISESEYIAYEQQASGLERRYGLPDGMLMNNVTKLLTNEVSATELNDRVLLASSAAIQAPTDVKDMFKNYYGVDSGGMTAYFLDPDVATPLLEKQYASSILGTEAARQGVGIDVYGAENLQSLGITQEQARQGFGTVAASKGLSEGRGDTVTQQQLIAGTLGQDQKAQQDIQRAVGGRLGRFQGGGEFLSQSGQNVGLGTAATR